MRFVKESENHSIGGLNPGMYRLMDETFCLTVCSEADTEEAVIEQLKNLPHSEAFTKLIVQ